MLFDCTSCLSPHVFSNESLPEGMGVGTRWCLMSLPNQNTWWFYDQHSHANLHSLMSLFPFQLPLWWSHQLTFQWRILSMQTCWGQTVPLWKEVAFEGYQRLGKRLNASCVKCGIYTFLCFCSNKFIISVLFWLSWYSIGSSRLHILTGLLTQMSEVFPWASFLVKIIHMWKCTGTSHGLILLS